MNPNNHPSFEVELQSIRPLDLLPSDVAGQHDNLNDKIRQFQTIKNQVSFEGQSELVKWVKIVGLIIVLLWLVIVYRNFITTSKMFDELSEGASTVSSTYKLAEYMADINYHTQKSGDHIRHLNPPSLSSETSNTQISPFGVRLSSSIKKAYSLKSDLEQRYPDFFEQLLIIDAEGEKSFREALTEYLKSAYNFETLDFSYVRRNGMGPLRTSIFKTAEYIYRNFYEQIDHHKRLGLTSNGIFVILIIITTILLHWIVVRKSDIDRKVTAASFNSFETSVEEEKDNEDMDQQLQTMLITKPSNPDIRQSGTGSSRVMVKIRMVIKKSILVRAAIFLVVSLVYLTLHQKQFQDSQTAFEHLKLVYHLKAKVKYTKVFTLEGLASTSSDATSSNLAPSSHEYVSLALQATQHFLHISWEIELPKEFVNYKKAAAGLNLEKIYNKFHRNSSRNISNDILLQLEDIVSDLQSVYYDDFSDFISVSSEWTRVLVVLDVTWVLIIVACMWSPLLDRLRDDIRRSKKI